MTHPVSAKTTYPNTPETDKCLLVMHTVMMSDGSTVQLLAADPIDAINMVHRRAK
jgi:hypothetical protein